MVGRASEVQHLYFLATGPGAGLNSFVSGSVLLCCPHVIVGNRPCCSILKMCVGFPSLVSA